MALRLYRGVEFVKDYMCQYLNHIFLAEEKGLIKFWDGTRKAIFSHKPYVVKKNSWDFRSLPGILVSSSGGNLEWLTFTNDILKEECTANTHWREYGGHINLTMEFEIIATTLEERDKLTDIVSIYLSGPTAKDYFEYHDIKVSKGVSMRDNGEMYSPTIDFPVYRTTISLDTTSTWRDREDINDPRLIDIIVELDDL